MEFVRLNGPIFAKALLKRAAMKSGDNKFVIFTLGRYVDLRACYVYMTDSTDAPVCESMEQQIKKRNHQAVEDAEELSGLLLKKYQEVQGVTLAMKRQCVEPPAKRIKLGLPNPKSIALTEEKLAKFLEKKRLKNKQNKLGGQITM